MGMMSMDGMVSFFSLVIAVLVFAGIAIEVLRRVVIMGIRAAHEVQGEWDKGRVSEIEVEVG